ncbi:CaiB/BaiF CoA-transferase family protein [Halorussus sp. MSC15.2]|uniref:CaiB/BaiF CoA transferase family protein n=1 Tax=Halorussus sp. MSC15.2 TaxID=2283638 RepID=UPI0013D643D4|nr:CoA transferase [Halorussus sp. MSC15.2]NEU58656.1 CoA transferase [Halorussus sp. MSC15.2]
MTGTDSARPLNGVRVLDCTQMLSGPFATQLLADLGAEVVKVERPEVGDITRAVGPTVGDSDVSSYFASLNRGKRSVELDLSTPAGAAAFERLAADADVVIENYRPGTMAEWGLGYDDLREVNEDLIYCSISGFLEGPNRDLAAFDMVVQALSGSMSVTGQADGPPARPGIPIGDICAGMYAALSVVTALSVRDQHGGQRVEVPMFEGLVSWLTERAGRTLATGDPYPRMGTAHPSLAPYRAFETADGWFAVAVGSEGTWDALCEAIDRPDLADDPRFETNADRVEHREELTAELAPLFAERSAEAWFDLFRERGVPGAPVRDTVEVFEDPQLRESDVTTDLSLGGIDMPLVQFPARFSGLSTGTDRVPPRLGEHTREVLDEDALDAVESGGE